MVDSIVPTVSTTGRGMVLPPSQYDATATTDVTTAGQGAAGVAGVAGTVTITPEQAATIAAANIKAVADAMLAAATMGFTATAAAITTTIAASITSAATGTGAAAGAAADAGTGTAAAGGGAFWSAGAAISTEIIRGITEYIDDPGIFAVGLKFMDMLVLFGGEGNGLRVLAWGMGKNVGGDITDGLVEGMSGPGAKSKFQSAADSIVSYIKDVLRDAALVKSPSRLFANEVGLPLTQGIAEGMFGAPAQRALTVASNRLLDYAGDGLSRKSLYNGNVPSFGSPAESNMTVVNHYQSNEYHLHVTSTPQAVERIGYSFAVMEAMSG